MGGLTATSARLGVRGRLTAVAVAASLVTLAVGGLLLYRNVTSALDSALTTELRSHADDLRDEVRRGETPSLGAGIEAQILDPGGSPVQPAAEAPLLDVAEVRVAARSGIVVDRDDDRRELRVVAVPVATPAGTTVVVAVAGSTASVTRTEHRLVGRLAAAGTLLVVASAASAWALSGGALRPVRSMSRRARSLSTQDPDERLPVPPGRDEVAELGVTLNQMLDRIAEARVHERAFIDDASHEMRAPLAVVRGELEVALLEHGSAMTDEVRQAVASALDETDRLVRLTDHLLVLARADAGEAAADREPVSMRDVVVQCLERVGSRDVELRAEDGAVEVLGDPVALERLVTNLVGNATTWAHARVRIDLEHDGAEVVLRVADDGPGFPADQLAHPFQRFRRGDPVRGRSGSSTGLGLAIAAAVVTTHGGTITIGNGPPLGGAWVEVHLPLAAAGADLDEGRPMPPPRGRVRAGRGG